MTDKRYIAMAEDTKKRLDAHLVEYATHRSEYLERQVHQDKLQSNNMEAIDKLTKATQGLVDTWLIANGIQKFFKWLSGFAFLGVIISWAVGFNPFK